MTLEQCADEMRVTYRGPRGDESWMSLPRGAHAGIGALLEGLSGIAARGRILPQDGRVALRVEGKRLTASIHARPGFAAKGYQIDLREERVAERSRQDLESDIPGLSRVLSKLAERKYGLLIVAGPGPAEAAVGLASVLQLLGPRLPRRIAVGEIEAPPTVERIEPAVEGEEVPVEALLDRALEEGPDLLVLPGLGRPGDPSCALTQARQRVVVASVAAVDAFDAVERVARGGLGMAARDGSVAGVLGVRLMETLCSSCRVSYDLSDVLSATPRYQTLPSGSFWSGPGCASCRGSGVLKLEPVYEFLSAESGDGLFRPGTVAAALREERADDGMMILFHAALERASTGLLDVRDPLRLLLHEQA
jgi:type II secretory ATPase GspE/PulE/Tfp pilus assembly ATPase PilB-like protein